MNINSFKKRAIRTEGCLSADGDVVRDRSSENICSINQTRTLDEPIRHVRCARSSGLAARCFPLDQTVFWLISSDHSELRVVTGDILTWEQRWTCWYLLTWEVMSSEASVLLQISSVFNSLAPLCRTNFALIAWFCHVIYTRPFIVCNYLLSLIYP